VKLSTRVQSRNLIPNQFKKTCQSKKKIAIKTTLIRFNRKKLKGDEIIKKNQFILNKLNSNKKNAD